ncbi:hypothetical protein [Desulfomonile tiedjei]|nr:hypothetical protein [Desulfomonile tiedjei]
MTDQRGTQVNFSTDHFIVNPQPSALIVAMKQIDDKSLLWAEQLVEDLLRTLPHTPVSAFGLNFAFTDEALNSELISLFRLSDADRLAENNYRTTSLSIQRSLQLDDAKLNAMLTMTEDDSLSVRLNFHHDVANAEEAWTRLTGRTLLYKADGLNFLQNVYGLRVKGTL